MGPFLMAAFTNAPQLAGGDAHFASTRLLSWELRLELMNADQSTGRASQLDSAFV